MGVPMPNEWLSPEQKMAHAELSAMLAAPHLSSRDLERLPMLAACLGVAVRVRRLDWSAGVHAATVTDRTVGHGLV